MCCKYSITLYNILTDVVIMLPSCNMSRMFVFLNIIIPVIFFHSDLGVHSKQSSSYRISLALFLFVAIFQGIEP